MKYGKQSAQVVALFISLFFLLAGVAMADDYSAKMYKTTKTGKGELIGVVTFVDRGGLLAIETDLTGLPPGKHGFHVHENPDCGSVHKDGKIRYAGAAGGHYDPAKTGKHLGPEGGGHKGDLPMLHVAANGTAKVIMKVKGLKAVEFKNRSLMIHAGGDNYSDNPHPLGGGGERIACGIIE